MSWWNAFLREQDAWVGGKRCCECGSGAARVRGRPSRRAVAGLKDELVMYGDKSGESPTCHLAFNNSHLTSHTSHVTTQSDASRLTLHVVCPISDLKSASVLFELGLQAELLTFARE